MIVLNKLRREIVLPKLLRLESLHEKPARVVVDGEVDQDKAVQLQMRNLHNETPVKSEHRVAGVNSVPNSVEDIFGEKSFHPVNSCIINELWQPNQRYLGLVQIRPHSSYRFTSLYLIRCAEGVCVCVRNELSQDISK